MKFDEADELLQAIRSIAVRHRALAATLLAPLGLYPGQEVILLELASAGPRTQSQLAVASGCEAPTISMAVRKLETAGLLERRPSAVDARATVVDLTAAGHELVIELKSVWRSLATKTIASMHTATPLPELTECLSDLAQSIIAAETAEHASNGRRRVARH